MRLLLIEDDLILGDALKTALTQFGYIVDWLRDGETARSVIKTESFELIILDLNQPILFGINWLQSIRQDLNTTPIIILTAFDSVEDRIKGLDSGADDYIIKPFDLNELGAKIRALIRRSHGRADTILRYRNITLDPAAHSVMLDGVPVNIPRREFSLLQKLLENSGQVLSRDQLTQSIYGWDDDVDSNVLEVHIHHLRKKLNATKLNASFIRTIRGVGYMVEK